MGIFHKTIKIIINSCESIIFVKIYINNIQISKIKCILQNDNSLLLGDIEPFIKDKYKNKGYGSMMMSKLFEYALINGIHKIYGYLSVVDKDHDERLHHFYEKHGFEIVIYEEPKEMKYGEIIKEL